MKTPVSPAPPARPRILHVEDSQDFANVVRPFLEVEGFEVEHARSVGEARVCLARDTPDLLLLDFYLPDGFGIDLLPSAIPAAVFSGSDDAAARREAGRRGAPVFVHKDARVYDLIAALHAARGEGA